MFIPELATLEKAIYDYKKIEDLDEDEEDTIIVGRIIELNEIRNFERDSGDTGSVRNIEIADDTGSIRVVLWDNDANRDLEMGQPLKIQNPRLTLDMDNRLQATVSGGTTVLDPSEKELENLPSQDELMESIFVSKSIESLYEDDTNVHITARIKEVFSDRILLKKCPNCGENVEESEDEFICDQCGHVFDEPRYTLMVPTRVEDETGEIGVTFFGDLAEELIGMKKEEIVSLMADTYDISDKLQDLVGMTIEIIANVSFNEYTEENRLNPKKLLNKYF
jgi:replication factor A1